MKRNLLLTGILALASWGAYGQIATYVLQPPELAGPLEFSLADGWGMLPDMNDPVNRVQAFAAIVDDGDPEVPEQGCATLVNTADIDGKIAVVWRGTCEFGTKALNAQNAGAIGVVIVNNAPGAPIAMGGGDNGASVSIPVVMITQDAGNMLREEIEAGNVEILIGTVWGMFPNNLGVDQHRILIPTMAARPALVSSDPGSFATELGAWVYNWGAETAAQSDLNVTVKVDGNTVYDETVSSGALSPGDSVFIQLPTFALNSYSGRYEITYLASEPDVEDDFIDDNIYATSLTVDSLVSYSPIGDDGTPNQDGYIRPADASLFQVCSHFKDPHASRLRAEGIYAAASMNEDDGTLVNQQLSVVMNEWNGDFTGISDAYFDELEPVMNGEYVYTEDLNYEVIYIPFFEAMPLEDNQRYLFCLSTNDDRVFLGHSSTVDYGLTEEFTDAITTVLNIGGSWYGGWTGGNTPAFAILMTDMTSGIQEMKTVELTPYPNPTNASISIPIKGMTGKASVDVYDTKGTKVLNSQVTVGGNNILTMNLNELQSGQYVFHVLFENGHRSHFNVVVAR